MTERLTATVYGRVQGVSFRYFTRRRAVALGIVGWVCNQSDGSVHVVAEGSNDMLDALEAFLQHGSPAAMVDRLHTKRSAATGEFTTFTIRYS